MGEPDTMRPNERQEGCNQDLPAAILKSTDLDSYFSLRVLKWETPLLPCTRYDEWLVCEISINDKEKSLKMAGPFLLRYELEEIYQAFQSVLSKDASYSFVSDFLEPVLKLQIKSSEKEENIIVDLNVAPRQEDELMLGKREPVAMTFSTSQSDCQEFVASLEAQLDGFMSLL